MSKDEMIEKAAQRMYEVRHGSVAAPFTWEQLGPEAGYLRFDGRAYWLQLARLAWATFQEQVPELGTIG